MPALHRPSARRCATVGDGRARLVTGGRRLALAVACSAAAAVVVAGCGSSSTPSSSSTGTSGPAASGTSAVCTQAGQLQASVRQLTSLNVVQQGTNGVKAAANNVQAQFDALKQTASSQYQSQVDALQSALSNLKNAGSQSNPVTAAADAVGQVGTAANALFDAISSSCPNGIPSVSASPLSTAS
jgi:hypothetical protein